MEIQINSLANRAAEVDQYCQDKGWRETPVSFGEAMALLHEEIAEAGGAWRKNGLTSWTVRKLESVTACPVCREPAYMSGKGPECPDHPDKPEGVPSEFADIFIRLLDDSVIFGIDPDGLMREHRAVYHVSDSFLENMNGLHMMVAKASEFYYDAGGSFRYQLARVLGLLLQLCDLYGIDLDAEYRRKMVYNKSRPYRHGGKKL